MNLAKEPLVHFVLLAACLFVLDHFFTSAQKEQILVDRQTAEYLIKQREDLMLRQLEPQEQQNVIESYVEDEILYNEAYNRGLDRGDSRMRRNMIYKMRGLLIGEIDAPTEKELRDYFEANRDKFTIPARLTFDHVVFNNPDEVPAELLMRLHAGADHNEIGDFVAPFGRAVSGITQETLIGAFGVDMARGVLAIDDDDWHGPFQSTQGAHFVRVTGRSSVVLPEYEDVAAFIEGEWTIDQSRQRIEQELVRIRDNYEIIIEPFGEAGE